MMKCLKKDFETLQLLLYSRNIDGSIFDHRYYREDFYNINFMLSTITLTIRISFFKDYRSYTPLP